MGFVVAIGNALRPSGSIFLRQVGVFNALSLDSPRQNSAGF